MSNNDDDFGGFEEATNTTTNLPPSNNTKLPDWLLSSPSAPLVNNNNNSTNLNAKSDTNNNNLNTVKLLQDELSRTKELLLDQQTNFLQLQTQHRQELEESGSSAAKALREFQNILERSLKQQREIMLNEFKTYQTEQENRIMRQLKEMNQRYEHQLNEKFETKLAEFQGSLIKHCESGLEDMEFKIKQTIDTSLKDEFLGDKLKLKQSFANLEKDLKSDMEKHIQTYFRNQSETYKEQIKSGVMQEHLIHKDLINAKLDKLYKASEEKRRRTQVLFARHLSGLNFFVDNAQKQLGILKEAHKDMLKNKDIIDFYGDDGAPGFLGDEKGGETAMSTTQGPRFDSLASLSSLSLATMGLTAFTKQGSKDRSDSKDNLYGVDDEGLLLDENLLS